MYRAVKKYICVILVALLITSLIPTPTFAKDPIVDEPGNTGDSKGGEVHSSDKHTWDQTKLSRIKLIRILH